MWKTLGSEFINNIVMIRVTVYVRSARDQVMQVM